MKRLRRGTRKWLRRLRLDRTANPELLEPARHLVNALRRVGKDLEAAMVADELGLTIDQLILWNEPPEAQMESLYGRTLGCVIRIGANAATVISVTQNYVVFVDEEGDSHSIDLEECHRNYVAWITKGRNQGDIIDLEGPIFRVRSESGYGQGRCVGFRGAFDHSAWMSFANEPPTMFEFRSRDELYQQLLTPLMRVGWNTFDAD